MREGSKAMNDSKLRVPEEEEFAMSETPLGAETTSPITVLLADDHALVREGTRRLLEAEADIRVVAEAGDGQTAVAEAERCRPDVAIVDVAMPGMSGIEATRHIKERLPNVAILALTAYDDDQYVLALIEAGAAGFMLKDAGARELVEAVRAVHRGDAVLQPSVAARALRRAVSRSTAPPVAMPHSLSEREMQVLREAARGLPNKDIARRLNLSVRTVHTHLGNTFTKLSVGSRTEAVLLALRRGWIALEDTEAVDADEPLPDDRPSGAQ